jgi:hypothetical protein
MKYFAHAPVWIRLYSLPQEFWLEEVLAGIGNTIGVYVKSSEAMKQRRYTSYVHICVHQNISKPLPRSITLEYHDEDWMQTIDYEHISFWCRKCHEHGHLFRDFPLNAANKYGKPDADKDKDGFAQVPGKRKQGGRKKITHASKDLSTNNKYEILQDQSENPSISQVVSTDKTPQQTGKEKVGVAQESNPMTSPTHPNTRIVDQPKEKDAYVKMDLDEEELAGVDLEHLEHAYRHQKLYTIPPDQL